MAAGDGGGAAKDTAMVPTGLFIQTLNEMIDDQGKRAGGVSQPRAEHRLPGALRRGHRRQRLCGLCQRTATTKRSRLPVYVTGILVSAMILLIQDLDRPGAGFIKVSQQPMVDTAAAIAGYVK